MVGVLADRHRDRKTDRVAAPLLELGWAFGRLDAATVAPILLPLVLDQDEAPLDDIDFVRFVKLTLEDSKLAAALRAPFIGLIERVHLLDARKLGLLTRTVAGLRLLLFGAALLPIALFAAESGNILESPRRICDGVDNTYGL